MDKANKEKKDLLKTLNELSDLQEEFDKAKFIYEKTCEEFWDKLSYDDKLKAFYSVVKRIHQAELVDRGSYRWALYDVFKFDTDAYGIGMECGYMELHNSITTTEESSLLADEVARLRAALVEIRDADSNLGPMYDWADEKFQAVKEIAREALEDSE